MKVSNYTFGMECEINQESRMSEGFYKFDWFTQTTQENNVIYEHKTEPVCGRTFLRRATMLGTMLGFEYRRGASDERAESFHLHIGSKKLAKTVDWRDNDCGVDDISRTIRVGTLSDASPLLLAAHHMKRSQGDVWRDRGSFVRDSTTDGVEGRSFWITNNYIGTTELRQNENPAPLIPTILLPTILNTKEFRIANAGLSYHAKPEELKEFAEWACGSDMIKDIIRKAKSDWDYYPLVTNLLDMFSEGADHIEVWEAADKWYRINNSREYLSMIKKWENQ